MVEPLESRQLLSSTTIQEFPTNSSSYPVGIVEGSDHNLWLTEELPDQLEVFNPTNNSSTLIGLTAGIAPQGITAGPDGNIWFTEAFGHNGNGQIAMVNPTTQVVTEFPALPNANSYPTHIVAGPDGNLWFTETSTVGHKAQIGMINPTTHAISEFPLPNPNSEPYGITVGSDGNLWFAEVTANQIGMINPTTHAIAEFAVPTPNVLPSEITAGPDGNLWFTEYNPNSSTQVWQLGMIDPVTHNLQQFPLTSSYVPLRITAGPDGNLWFTSEFNNTSGIIREFNPVTHGVDFWATHTANAYPTAITTGPGGSLWFAGTGAHRTVGEATPALHLVVTSPPPAYVPPGGTFNLTVTVNYDTGLVDAGYNGPINLVLANNSLTATLGGQLTGLTNGVATFSGLSINQTGNYRLLAFTDPLTTTLTTPVTVAIPPTIVTEKLLITGKGRHRHVVGVELDFSRALDPTRAGNVLPHQEMLPKLAPLGGRHNAITCP